MKSLLLYEKVFVWRQMKLQPKHKGRGRHRQHHAGDPLGPPKAREHPRRALSLRAECQRSCCLFQDQLLDYSSPLLTIEK